MQTSDIIHTEFWDRLTKLDRPKRELLIEQIVQEEGFGKLPPLIMSNILYWIATEDGELIKKKLLEIAEEVGPEDAQIFYHAAVFMTRVVR